MSWTSPSWSANTVPARGFVMAMMVLSPVPCLATDQSTCEITTADKVANAKLSFDDFDQKGTSPSTWRVLDDRGCYNAASEAMQDFLVRGSVSDPRQRANMAFHLGQSLAKAGRDRDAAVAIANAKAGATPDPDGFDWNAYVSGTWAFLARDRTMLEAAHAKLAGLADRRNRVNASALAGLLGCYDRPYAEAYAKPCRDASKTGERVTVEITLDGTGAMTWNGKALQDDAALEARLAEISGRDPQPIAHDRATPDVGFEQMKHVMALMQRYGIGAGIVGNVRPD